MGKTAGEHIVENPSSEMGGTVYTKDGTIRDRPTKVPRDEFFVSDAKRKALGVQDHEELYWARDAKVWSKIEFVDRQEQLMADVEDGGMNARLVTTKEEDAIHIGNGGDLVLMAIPKAVREQQQQEIDEANRVYEAPFRRTEKGYVLDEKDVGLDRANLRARMDAESEWLHSSSPTVGMSYIEAENYYKRAKFDVKGHQEMLRMGGHHVEQSQDQFREMMTGMRTAKKFGIGTTGLGKTTAQKVAERAGRRQ